MIVDINEGNITSFTVSELPGINHLDELLDVATYQSKVLVLTANAYHQFEAQIGDYYTNELQTVRTVPVDDAVKLCGKLVVKFDLIDDLELTL